MTETRTTTVETRKTGKTGTQPPRAFDDLLNLSNPITPQRVDRQREIARIRAEIEAGRYLTEDRIRGAIRGLWQKMLQEGGEA